jgi:hypothetical protein
MSMTHFHICKNENCSKPFWGRKNQLYHDLSCKASHNNEKAAVFRKELLDNNIMQKSYFILKVFHKLNPDDEPVDFKELLEAGLDAAAPVRLYQTAINGYDYKIIHGFGYRFLDKTKKQVIINSIDEIKRL